MKISIAIMAHPKREPEAVVLLDRLKKMPFCQAQIIYDTDNNEWETGVRCWLEQDQSSVYSIVIQDDAIIDQYFYKNLLQAINTVPKDSMISFYTGKVRPWATKVSRAVAQAEAEQASWLAHPFLFWGVCVAMPTKIVPTVINEVVKFNQLQYDFRLGKYFKDRNIDVYYTHPSIVDHNANMPSLTGHDKPNRQPRVAHKYTGGAHKFNSKAVQIKV